MPSRSPRSIVRAVSFALACAAASGCGPSDAPPAADGAGHVYLQFDGVPTEAELNELAVSGINVTGHAIGTSYIGSTNSTVSAAKVRNLGPIPASAKAGGDLLEGRVSAWAVDPAGRARVRIAFHSDVSEGDALRVVHDAGAELRSAAQLPSFRMLEIAVDPAALRDLANNDAVRWLRETAPPKLMNNSTAASVSKVTPLWSAPYGPGGTGLSGQGCTVGIWDGGAVFPHVEFETRLGWAPDTAAIPAHWHSTHVAGTVGAAGLNTQAHGMAHRITLRSYQWDDVGSEYLSAAAGGIIAGNNSWGIAAGWEASDGQDYGQQGFGAYTIDTREFDDAVWQADQAGNLFICCFAAGNERDDVNPGTQQHDGTLFTDPSVGNPYYDTLQPSATGKNTITVGSMSSFNGFTLSSSIGPVDDGRIKPDLVAKGQSLLSTDLDNGYYSSSGTSMACPVVTGGAALIVEQFETAFRRRPTTSEAKALLIHTTIDRGRPGPDYLYGWGLLNTQAAADLVRADGGAGTRILNDAVGHGNHDAFSIQVSDSLTPLRVTLTWIDPPGTPDDPAPDLVNNLDLRLLSPTGIVHYPFRLNPAAPVANATATGPNLVDTVEQVLVTAPQAGTWRIEVGGTSVPVGPAQRYALVGSHTLTRGWTVEQLQQMQTDIDGAGNTVLSWPAVPDPAVIGFRVYRSIDRGASWSLIGELPAGSISYVDTSTPAAPLIFYDVRALVDVSGEALFSPNPGSRQTDPPSLVTPAEGASLAYTGIPTTITGVAEPQATVTFFNNGIAIGSTTAGSDGGFTFNGHIFARGAQVLTASARQGTDASSIPSYERRFTVN